VAEKLKAGMASMAIIRKNAFTGFPPKLHALSVRIKEVRAAFPVE
jgi:hypothetical protein